MDVSSKQIFINGDDSATADDDKERVVFPYEFLDNFTNASDFYSERMFS